MNAPPTKTGAIRVVVIPREVTRAHAWLVSRWAVTASLATVILTHANKGFTDDHRTCRDFFCLPNIAFVITVIMKWKKILHVLVTFIKIARRVEIYSSSLILNTSDVDECLAWTFDCEDDSQMCENTYGSYKCVCAEGLFWIGGQCKGEIPILLIEIHSRPPCADETLFTTQKVAACTYPPLHKK